jgi:transketolase
MQTLSKASLDDRSRHLRRTIVDALEGGGRGHVGSALSLIEILRVLFDDVLQYRVSEPHWPGRDRFILSKGHGSLALYTLLADKGFISRDDLLAHCKPGALLGGHPESHIPGVEVSTGALGHGLPLAVGMALAARMQRRRSRVFVVMGDGELQEGSVWEASLAASKHRLDNLIAIVDYNKLQCYGPITDVLPLEPLADKFSAFGWAVREVDGHDVAALRAALQLPFEADKPNLLIAHTVKGRGVDFAEFNPQWHHKSSFKTDDFAKLRAAMEHTR